MQSAKYYVIIRGLCLCLSQRTQNFWWTYWILLILLCHQSIYSSNSVTGLHNDVIKWKHFLRYWPFVRGIHRSPVNSTHKGQWRKALMFSLICVWINGWVSNRKAGDLRRYRTHYDVIVMIAKMAEQFFRSQPISSWVFVLPLINILRPRQNGRHFGRRRFHVHFLGWKLLNFK